MWNDEIVEQQNIETMKYYVQRIHLHRVCKRYSLLDLCRTCFAHAQSSIFYFFIRCSIMFYSITLPLNFACKKSLYLFAINKGEVNIT